MKIFYIVFAAPNNFIRYSGFIAATVRFLFVLINPSPKQVTRCVNETQPNLSKAIRVSGGNSNTIGSRARIDMAKSQVADCHLFGARVNSFRVFSNLIRFWLALLKIDMFSAP